MSKGIEFEAVGNEENVMRIGGMSFLSEGMECPVNPNGEEMESGYIKSGRSMYWGEDEIVIKLIGIKLCWE